MPLRTSLYDYWFEFCDTEPTASSALRRAMKGGYGTFVSIDGKLRPLKGEEASCLADLDANAVILVQNTFA